MKINFHNENKSVFLNKNCFRHSMNRIQIEDHRIGTYKIIKTSMACFNDRIYIQNNGYDELPLTY